jgi:hypothetical protein
MRTRSRDLLKCLSQIDPTRVDPAPRKGSSRYHSILGAAMHTHQDPEQMTPAGPPAVRAHWRRNFAIAAAVLVAAVAATLGAVLPQLGQPAAYAEVIRTAAQGLVGATTVRGTTSQDTYRQYEDDRIATSSVTGTFAVEGANRQTTLTYQNDGELLGPATFTSIGNTLWFQLPSTDGSPSVTRPVARSDDYPEYRIPLSEAARSLLEAVLADASVSFVGTETVREQAAAHYRLGPTKGWSDSIDQLSSSVKRWFGIDDTPSTDYTEIVVDVWVSDGVLFRLRVEDISRFPGPYSVTDGEGHRTDLPTQTRSVVTNEYYDYGVDFHIEPPSES